MRQTQWRRLDSWPARNNKRSRSKFAGRGDKDANNRSSSFRSF
jgi:hypothetical protein